MPKQPPSEDRELTRLFGELEQGNPAVLGRIFELLYTRLRAVAAQVLKGVRSSESVRVTPMIGELYLRFAGGKVPRFKDKQHLFRTVARTVRHVLVDLARERKSQKRGGGARPVSLNTAGCLRARESLDVLELDDLLATLAVESERASAVAEMRLFGGLSVEEIARALDISEATVAREWRFARAWLGRQLRPE